MPQNSNPRFDKQAATLTSTGASSSLAITAATVVKATAGRIVRVSVIVAGSTVGGVFDSNVTTGNIVANQLGVIPAAVGFTDFSFPCSTGILIVPGTGQTVSVTYN